MHNIQAQKTPHIVETTWWFTLIFLVVPCESYSNFYEMNEMDIVFYEVSSFDADITYYNPLLENDVFIIAKLSPSSGWT